MNNTITISWNELQQQIDLRNFYMGESAKRNDLNADTMQSCKDDDKLMLIIAQKACNELITAVAVRFPEITSLADTTSVTFGIETETAPATHLVAMLKQGIKDYLANEIGMHWLLTVRPDMAQTNISLRNSLYNNVQMTFAKIYNKQRIRRRPTDLAGI